jgi:flagellar biosynthetic protein FliR
MTSAFDLAAFSAASFWEFLQVFVRVSALLVTAPVFGSREIPAPVKAGLAGTLSLVLLPLVRGALGAAVPPTVFGMAAALLGQAVIGLMIGLVVSLLFVAARIGGDLIDYGMGFTQAATFNPQFNETVSPIAGFQYRYALVLYLVGNGHWLLLAALTRSFVKLPVSQLSVSGLAGAFTDVTFQTLAAGLQIAAPAAAVLLVTDLAFAFLNRAMPQMQVFYVGMPVKVLVGFVVVAAALPLMTATVAHLVAGSPDGIGALLRGMHR